MPDRDYYFDEDKQDKREAYLGHVKKMLVFLGIEDDPKSVIDLEQSMAKSYLTRTENRDPQVTYNKMKIDDLTTDIGKGKFDFASYLRGSTGKTVEELGEINVRQTGSLSALAEIMAEADSQALSSYLKFHVIHSYAPYLTKAVVDENFDFYERTLSGTQEQKPRWKRAMGFLESALGEALGERYCESFFDESCKTKALEIVECVRQALEDRLKEVDWIKSDSTRQEALRKMSKFRVKIGYPNKWIDYSSLHLDASDNLVEMVAKARAFEHSREVAEMNAPTDREKWFMTPQTVNAYYHPNLNEIVFPAAILQHPFFDVQAYDAVNFGAMGAVIG